MFSYILLVQLWTGRETHINHIRVHKLVLRNVGLNPMILSDSSSGAHRHHDWPSHLIYDPDNNVHGANMGPTWVRSAPGGPHIGLMNLAIWGGYYNVYNGYLGVKRHRHVKDTTCIISPRCAIQRHRTKPTWNHAMTCRQIGAKQFYFFQENALKIVAIFTSVKLTIAE